MAVPRSRPDLDARERHPSAGASRTPLDDPLFGAFDGLPDAVWIFAPLRDEHGTIVDYRWEFANGQATDLSRHPTDELVGRSLFEVRPDLVREGVLETFETVLDTGIPWRSSPPASHDGVDDAHGVPRHLDVTVTRIDGRLLVVARDVTEWFEHNRRDTLRRRELDAAIATAQSLTRLVHGMNALQICTHVEEAMQIIARAVPLIFEGSSGAIYTPSRWDGMYGSISTWGDFHGSDLTKTDDCWALRGSAVHFFGDDPLALRCPHASGSASWTACVPLIAQGQTMALVHLQNGGETRYSVRQLIEVMSTQWSLILANLLLQESLRNQSVRDALTGLFNRRFLDESLEREIHRARRHEISLCVVMLDLDHFKAFNDTHGHLAGDAALRDLGQFLLEVTRGSDVVGRFGGEEFVMIMPHMGRGFGRTRIESLLKTWRRRAKATKTRPGLPTFSAGVAYYAEGQSSTELLSTVDAALYQAKVAGRNRVVVRGDPNEPDTGLPMVGSEEER